MTRRTFERGPFVDAPAAAARVAPRAPSTTAAARLLESQRALGNARTQELLRAAGAQSKLVVSEPGDPAEREADRIADALVTAPAHPRYPADRAQQGDPVAVAKAPLSASARDPALSSDADLEAAIRALDGRGQPLPEHIRGEMEPRLGHDLAHVRVHADGDAAALANAVGARAFTAGTHVVFGGREYDPTSSKGRHLLAHELAHVVQQSAAPAAVVSRKGKRASKPAPTPAAAAADEADRQRHEFIHRCTPALAHVNSSYATILGKTEALGVQYMTAWERHTGALGDAGLSERLNGEIALDAALAFLPGGLSGSLGALLRKRGAGDFLVDGAKDLLKITLRRQISRTLTETEGFTPPPGRPGPAFQAVDPHPFKWRGSAAARIAAESAFMLETVEAWSLQATNDVANRYRYDFDPHAEIRNMIRVSATAPKDIPDATDVEALRIEKGFWKSWTERHRFYLQTFNTRAGKTAMVADRTPQPPDVKWIAGRHVLSRIEALAAKLNEDGTRWLDDWGAGSRNELQAEADKINEQSSGGQLKKFFERLLK